MPDNYLKTQKNILRSEYRRIRRSIPADEKAEMDRRICERIRSLVSYRFADSVLFYYPKADEVDLLPLFGSAVRANKKAAFPVAGDGGTMEFRCVDDPGTQMAPGRFGVPEPKPDRPVLDRTETGRVLILIPALSYDLEGYRLGYGKGYYDRYTTGPDSVRLGVCYSSLLTDRLPRGRFDTAVDLLVTEKGVHFLGKH